MAADDQQAWISQAAISRSEINCAELALALSQASNKPKRDEAVVLVLSALEAGRFSEINHVFDGDRSLFDVKDLEPVKRSKAPSLYPGRSKADDLLNDVLRHLYVPRDEAKKCLEGNDWSRPDEMLCRLGWEDLLSTSGVASDGRAANGNGGAIEIQGDESSGKLSDGRCDLTTPPQNDLERQAKLGAFYASLERRHQGRDPPSQIDVWNEAKAVIKWALKAEVDRHRPAKWQRMRGRPRKKKK